MGIRGGSSGGLVFTADVKEVEDNVFYEDDFVEDEEPLGAPEDHVHDANANTSVIRSRSFEDSIPNYKLTPSKSALKNKSVNASLTSEVNGEREAL